LKIFISTNGIFLNTHCYPFTVFCDLEEIIFEKFNISEHNIISVELAKVLGYLARNIPFLPPLLS
jgi:hypothetical protein